MTHYRFEQVRAALQKHWGLGLWRGGEMGDGRHDGRWTVEYSKSGYIAGGEIPGRGHGFIRYDSLVDVADAWDLKKVIGCT